MACVVWVAKPTRVDADVVLVTIHVLLVVIGIKLYRETVPNSTISHFHPVVYAEEKEEGAGEPEREREEEGEGKL